MGSKNPFTTLYCKSFKLLGEEVNLNHEAVQLLSI